MSESTEMIPAKVVIGVPHLGGLPGYFVDSFLSLQRPPGSELLRMADTAIDVARNGIVHNFLATEGATHLFFMDSDMTFPPEALVRLLQRGVDVVSGLYFARGRHTLPHTYRFEKEDETGQHWYRHIGLGVAEWIKRHPEERDYPDAWAFDYPDEPLMEVDAVGGGCLLLSRRVMQEIYNEHGPYWFKCAPGSRGGEDFDFSRKAAALGYRLHVDLNVQCGHEMRPVFTGRMDFRDIYRVGEEDEHDWNVPIVVQVTPNKTAEVVKESFRFPYGVEGYLSPEEGFALYRLAQQMPEGAVAVEQGTYKGLSAICIAQSGRELYCVDQFAPEHLVGSMASGQWEDHKTGAYRAALEENLLQHLDGQRGLVKVVEGPTDVVPKDFSGQVGLLFVDADHSEEATRANFEAWRPYLHPEGVVAFHDIVSDNVQKVVDEVASDGWETVAVERNLMALRRKKEEAHA